MPCLDLKMDCACQMKQMHPSKRENGPIVFTHAWVSGFENNGPEKNFMPIVWNITLTPNRITNLRCPSPSLFDVQNAGGSKSGPHALLHLFSASVPFARDVTTHVLVWARQGNRPPVPKPAQRRSDCQPGALKLLLGLPTCLGLELRNILFLPDLSACTVLFSVLSG